MSTCANIGILDGSKLDYIYINYDGYPSYIGSILLSEFNTLSIIERLIDDGDASSIGDPYFDLQSFPKSIHVSDLDASFDRLYNSSTCEHFYIFDAIDREWYYSGLDSGDSIVPLDTVI